MQFPKTGPRFIAATLAAALALPAAASAHVTLQPTTAPAGGFTRLDVRVPNERDDAGTVKVAVQLPEPAEFISYEPRPGWKVTMKRDGDRVSQVTWTGDGKQGIVRPGQFVDFGLSLQMPEGSAGDTLTYKAVQTYDSGEIVRWIGPEGSDTPAPIVTLAGAEEDTAHAPTAATTAPPPADDDDGDTLAIIGLVAGLLGLVAGVAGLLAARRARTAVPVA